MARNDYIVIGYRHHDRAYGLTRALFQVYNNASTTPGNFVLKDVKDVQDSVARLAEEHPEIIYTVVLEEDYRKIFREILENYFAGWGERPTRRRGRR